MKISFCENAFCSFCKIVYHWYFQWGVFRMYWKIHKTKMQFVYSEAIWVRIIPREGLPWTQLEKLGDTNLLHIHSFSCAYAPLSFYQIFDILNLALTLQSTLICSTVLITLRVRVKTACRLTPTFYNNFEDTKCQICIGSHNSRCIFYLYLLTYLPTYLTVCLTACLLA